uniref:DUF5648 domain-containing protein n=1 Tax=Eubacterium cellulosolvens (strain ATCC 43171 / JCM 9499 / 6) TaxID=633697 RepID=I5AVL1_EUBC6
MKNKIVKALVLASIVSMTATGAAGLTFAEDTTGKTTENSVDTSTTAKSIDQKGAAITEAQKDVDKTKKAFDKAFVYFEAQDKAVDAYVDLRAQEEHTRLDYQALLKSYFTDGNILQVDQADWTEEKIKASLKDEDKATEVIALNELGLAWFKLTPAEGEWVSVDAPEASKAKLVLQGAPTAEGTYNSNKVLFDSEKTKVFKDYPTIADKLTKAYNDEEAARKVFEEAMADVAASKPDDVETAKTDLQQATADYKAALAALDAVKKAYDEATVDTVPIYRLYHPGTGEHLYTDSTNERDTLVKGGIWQDEKVAMLAANKEDEDAIPVYRLCYPLTGDHHYTTDKNEVTTLIKTQGWVDEHEAFYVKESGEGVSVWRLYNSGLKLGAHHFTTGKNEYNTLKNFGWRQEGVAFGALAADYVDTSAIKTKDERIDTAEAMVSNNQTP